MTNLISASDRFQRKLDDRANKIMASTFRILVVDDEPSILELVKTALETLDDYNVSTATNAIAALEEIRRAERPFDCILLDIQMPETDGIELLRGLRSLPDYADIPILMLTAMSDRSYIDEAFKEGATDYVNKPFDFLELRSRIKCAHQLVDERRKTELSQKCAYQLQQKMKRNKQFNFDDPISVSDVDKHLRYLEFDNYVTQLARRKLFNSQSIAIKIQDAQLLYEKQDCDSFRNAIQTVAESIQLATHKVDCVFSYRGGGIFLVISHDAKGAEALSCEKNLNTLIQERTPHRQTAPEPINVLVSNSVPMRGLSRSAAATALQDAISNVNELELALQKDQDTQTGTMHDHRQDLRKQTRKRVYERVLFELFGEENYLNMR